jgi:hypothetical protein
VSGVYVYAVTRSDHPLRLDGLRTVGGTDDPPARARPRPARRRGQPRTPRPASETP